MTISYKIDTTGMTRGLTSPDKARAEILKACMTWYDALHESVPDFTLALRFRFGSLPEGTVARCTRTDGGKGADIVFSNIPGMALCHMDTGFFRRYWLGAIDLYTVALHETGHALGLPHSERITSIMDPQAPYSRFHKGLPAPDIADAIRLINTNTIPL